VDEACPYTPASPRDERESTETNEFIREREELEAALATVNVKGGHSWL
jgi:hypothetical protein